MRRSRRLSLAALSAVATAWAACLVVGGLWLADQGRRYIELPRGACILLGLAAVAAGLCIFMVIVADRLFPGVGRRQSMWRLEMTAFLLMIASLASAVISYGGVLS